MNLLARAISSQIREKIEAHEDGSEVRVIFHGPPTDILEMVFDELQGAGLHVPTLLLVPKLDAGAANPPMGMSGWCDDTHLLDLRNSPARPAFLALVSPGLHNMRSITSTSDEFGVAAASNGSNSRFEDWWSDAFIQGLVELGLSQAGIPAEEWDDAKELARRAAQAFDDMDRDRSRRGNAWHFLSRLFSIKDSPTGLAPAERVSLVCGVPPTGDKKVSASEQMTIVGRIAGAMADGFGTGIKNAKSNASDADKQFLDSFLQHLTAVCNIPTTFERATQFFYSPVDGLEAAGAPPWWSALTTEKWSEFLSEEALEQGDILVSCSNALIDLPKRMPVLVKDEVELTFSAKTTGGMGARISLHRSRTLLAEIDVAAGNSTFVDAPIPRHQSPLRYKVSADGFKPASASVISLENWQPGIFIACRNARDMKPPRKPRGKDAGLPDFETSLTLPGMGRYELFIFTAEGVTLNQSAFGRSEDNPNNSGDDPDELAIEKSGDGKHVVNVEANANYQVEIGFDRSDGNGALSSQTLRISLTVEDVTEQGCRNELERLILLNRRRVEAFEKLVVQVNRNAHSTTLQDWILSKESVAASFQPCVLATDYEGSWIRKRWGSGKGPVFSSGSFLHDPRPGFDEFDPPKAFIEAREFIADRVRGEDHNGLFETAELGSWYEREPEFAKMVEQYVDSYASWLASSPSVACWADVTLVCSLDSAGKTISQNPDAILLSPLHPARLGWHVVAQRVLLQADEASKPCPAVSVLDPDCVPDLLTLVMKSPGGDRSIPFVSVENGTDYWSVLWNGNLLSELPRRSSQAPFGANFGITVGGISTSFTAGQVMRALDDVAGLVAAKPRISLVVDSSEGTSDSCNEGIISWGTSRLGPTQDKNRIGPAGSRTLDVFDHRESRHQPDEVAISNLSQDTGNKVRWFNRQPESLTPDLGIIAQLGMAEPNASLVEGRSALGYGGLLRHRIRGQLPGAFMSETRQSGSPTSFDDPLANKVASCISSLESQAVDRNGINFAPNVHALQDMLEQRNAQFVATSSSAVDPAAFLSGWLEEAYLWDYDLPSYSRRSGDTNGYYLLSKVKPADKEALARAVSRLPGTAGLEDAKVNDILHEIARRGIPTVRGMSGEDSGSTGDLGVFVAARLLQDSFRPAGGEGSLVPVLEGEAEDDVSICLVVPVDPFKSFLEDLAKSLVDERKNASLLRPDLLSIGVRIRGEDVRIHLTPIEVKCHPDSVFPNSEIGAALDQAKNLSRVLTSMLPHEGQPLAWALGFQHLLLSILNFGMRVYSQNRQLKEKQGPWSRLHEKIASAILSPDRCVSVDQRGRLIIVDNSVRSGVADTDNDGFFETVTVCAGDAGTIVAGDPGEIYTSVRARIKSWDLLPTLGEAGVSAAAVPVTKNPPGGESKGETSGQQAPGRDSGAPLPRIAGNASLAGSSEGRQVTGQDDAIDAAVQAAPPGAPAVTAQPDSLGVRLSVGKSVDGFQQDELELNISDTRLNQLNMGVVGDLGTGKTQLLKSLIYQVASSSEGNRGQAPRFLIFDYKRDYSSPEFVAATGAKVITPHRLPLNLFDTSSIGQSLNPQLDRFRFFTDVLDKIYSGVGPVQRAKLKDAVLGSYASCLPGQQPTLFDVREAYARILDGRSDSPMSIIDDLVDMEVFSASSSETIPFDQFLDGVVVISLDAFGQDDRSKNMLVAVMLNMFYENMLRTEKKPFLGTDPQLRAIHSFLLVDEADNIMQYQFDVLKKLLLQGREFGTGVILASQYLRHFKVNATDYREPLLTWFIHKVPNISASELSALGLAANNAEAAERIKSLEVHQCLYKSHATSGEVIRGTPFFEIQRKLGEGQS